MSNILIEVSKDERERAIFRSRKKLYDWKGSVEIIMYQEGDVKTFDDKKAKELGIAMYRHYDVVYGILDSLNIKFQNFKHDIGAIDVVYGCIDNHFFAKEYSKYDEETEDYIFLETPYSNLPCGYLNEHFKEIEPEDEIKEEKLKLARNLIKRGLDVKNIAEDTGLSVTAIEEEINKIEKTLR
jgi:hypothetical protein